MSMTKSRKPAAITFPIIAKGVRRNAETGVEIHSDIDGYTIFTTSRSGTRAYAGATDTLTDARAEAVARVEMVRDQVAADHADALEMDATETERIAAQVVDGVAETVECAHLSPATRVVKALLSGALASARHGFVQVGRDRLARARAVLAGDEKVQSDAQADAELKSFNDRNPVGTRVELIGDRLYGARGRIAWEAIISAADNRASVMVKLAGRGHVSAWCDELRPLVGRDRP
jgi:hypothetical protein